MGINTTSVTIPHFNLAKGKFMNGEIFSSYPWYFDDWFKSETRLGFSLEERGLYRELLDVCWDKGSLPNDHEMLAQMVALRGDTCRPFSELLKKVLTQFTLESDGRWHHRKVEAKRQAICGFKDERRNSGRKGGLATQRKRRELKSQSSSGSSSPKADLKPSPSPSPSPSLSKTEIVEKAAAFSTTEQEPKTPPPPPSAGKQTRKPPGMETAPDFSTHDAEKVELVRAYMAEIAKVAHLPPCDDQLLARVLEICRAVHVSVVFDVIRDLVRRRRLQNIQSWGLIPLLLQNYFKARAAGA